MTKSVFYSKKVCEKKAQTLPLAPGGRVRVRDRNGIGQGKLHPGRKVEPHVTLEQVTETVVVYKVQPEERGREKMLHRNSLKLLL